MPADRSVATTWRAGGGDPAGALAGAGADLEHPAAAHVAQQPQLVLAPALGPPDEVGVTEEGAVLGVVLARLGVPPRPVGGGGFLGTRLPAADLRILAQRHTPRVLTLHGRHR